jgi:hypothetical protein
MRTGYGAPNVYMHEPNMRFREGQDFHSEHATGTFKV